MSQFAGNPHDNIFVAASRGQLFVPGENESGKRTSLTKKGKIIIGVSVALLIVLALGLVFWLSANKISLPGYGKLTALLGCPKEEVEKKIPEEVKYAGETFTITPSYKEGVLHGFSYTTVINDTDEAAEAVVKIVKNMYRVMDEAQLAEIDENALNKEAITDALKEKPTLRWEWNATEHSNTAVRNYLSKVKVLEEGDESSELARPAYFYLRVHVVNIADAMMISLAFYPG